MQNDDQPHYAAIRKWMNTEWEYRLLAMGVEGLLRRESAARHMRIFSVTWRSKSLLSTLRKSQRRAFKALGRVTDRAGVRVICPHLDELDKVLHLIKGLFRVRRIEAAIPRNTSHSTGYASYHCLVRWDPAQGGPYVLPDMSIGSASKKANDGRPYGWNAEREKMNNRVLNLTCEIQVRTLIQHAWADISREFFYEREKSIPESVRLRLRELGILLREVDEGFVEAIKGSSGYAQKTVVIATSNDSRLTQRYLRAYSSAVLGQSLPEDDASNALRLAQEIGVSTTGAFEHMMLACFDALWRASSDMLLVGLFRLVFWLGAILYWVKGSGAWLRHSKHGEVLDKYRELLHQEMLEELQL